MRCLAAWWGGAFEQAHRVWWVSDIDTSKLVTDLLSIRTWTAFDVDDEGRVLAGHDELGAIQLVEIAPDGTRTPLTDLPGRCAGRYLPGRRQVVVQHDQGGDEKGQLSLLDLDVPRSGPAGLADLTELVRDEQYLHVLQEVTPTSLVYTTNRRNGVDMDLVVRDWSTGAEEVVYDDGGFVAAAQVSQDGSSAAVVRLSLQPTSTVVEVVGPHAQRAGIITDPEEYATHGQPAWTAGDRALILTSNHNREHPAIFRVSLDGQNWEVLAEDDSTGLTNWVAPDASAMLIGRHVDGTFPLSLHSSDGSLRHTLDIPALGTPSVTWSADGGRLVVSGSTPTEPGAVYLVDAGTGDVTLVASAAAETDPQLRAAFRAPTVHRVPTPDGEQIPCFVYAADPDPDLAGASVLHIHGGPESASYQGFSPIIQALATLGLTVLVPNVRGSAEYGKRWVSLDDRRLRLDSVGDLAALHAWLPELGLDQDRSALYGGSYGGYMVLAGVSMQPQLWAAGVDIVGMSSLVTFLENTADYRRAYREREYGSLEHDRQFLTEASPITYLDQIRAPLFVIHGANDPRVPLSEAEQIEAALTRSGVPCELRVYADEGHGLAKRANRLDAYPAALDFLRSHLARS